MSKAEFPPTKAARHARIAQLLGEHEVYSQAQLSELLESDGIIVTQATLSRDLDELGARKERGAEGAVYRLPEGDPTGPDPGWLRRRSSDEQAEAKLARLMADLLVSVEGAGQIAVLRTPPAAANLLASALDFAPVDGVMGTIAGDDTILIACRDPVGGERVAARLRELADRIIN